jgi:hypothetical protein
MQVDAKTKSRATAAPPGADLYCAVRAAFVRRGTSLNAWCKSEGVSRQYAAQVLSGESTGPSAKALVARLLSAALDA